MSVVFVQLDVSRSQRWFVQDFARDDPKDEVVDAILPWRTGIAFVCFHAIKTRAANVFGSQTQRIGNASERHRETVRLDTLMSHMSLGAVLTSVHEVLLYTGDG